MRPNKIEGWVLQVADDIIKHNRPVEDTRVEIKSTWLDPKDMARRIAAHANAAQGEPVLWIIGIDERNRKVLGADKKDLAAWYPKVQAEFSELAPLVTDLNISYDGTTIVAILFDTDRAPFVVKNPVFGNTGAGPVSLEVPWREGTGTRSATRADLLRLLLPLEQLPDASILALSLIANINDQALNWRLSAKIYISSRTREEMIFPFHSCSAIAHIGDERREVLFDQIIITPYPRPGPGMPVDSKTIRSSPTEIVVASAGMAFFDAYTNTIQSVFGNNIGDPAHVRIDLVQAHDSRPISLHQTITSIPGPQDVSARWGTWGVPVI